MSGKSNPYLQHLEGNGVGGGGGGSKEGRSGGLNPYNLRPFSDRYYEILEVRKRLPVYDHREELVKLVGENPIIVLVGETGSGKTTQTPQFLVDAGYSKDGLMVACTQPRRVAAMSVAKRVAEEMDVVLGLEVGYTIRFEDKTSSKTLLKYCTDGMLLREAMHDPDLSRYGCIVIDEAHERTLATDLLLGILKGVVMERKSPLKLVVMSATLDATKFMKYFDGAPLLEVPGRVFPVEILYLPEPAKDYFEHAVSTAVYIHQHEEPGDVLVFLTGEEEIEEACRRVTDELYGTEKSLGPLIVLPLYASLPPDRQQRVFEPAPPADYAGGPPGRKIIFATNIAETSLTIDGVVYVVDSGFSKQKTYNPRVRSEALQVTAISKASARQRTGRAGRTRPGKCFRLYTENAFKRDLIETSYPEIQRSNIGNLVLQMKTLGIKNLVRFDFVDPPAPETMIRALEQLHFLGAISKGGELTDVGQMLSEFPLEPELSKMLISSPKFHCSNEALSIASMLSAASNVFLRPQGRRDEADEAKAKFMHPEGDHGTLLNVYHSFKQNADDQRWCFDNYLNGRALRSADNIRSQLERIMLRMDLSLESVDYDAPDHFNSIARCICAGYFMQAAYADRASYMTVKDTQPVLIHPSSVLMSKKPKYIVFNEFVLTSKNYVRTLTTVRPEWLLDIAPHYYAPTDLPKDSKFRTEVERLIRNRENRKRSRDK